MANDPEQLRINPENNLESIGETANERREQLREHYESSPERPVEHAEKTAERARVEALESAVSVEASGAEKARDREPSAPIKRVGVSKKDRTASYQKTMTQVQSEMSAPARAFSKVIHNKAVESASETIGSTIARPNAILAGSLCAFILSFALYLIGKRLGYTLSGFETIGAFVAGWIIGLLFDYLKVLITGKKS